MLRSVAVTAVLALPETPFHNLHWRDRLELSLDCFVCQRTGRTTTLVHGAERAVCSGDSETPEHYTAARIAAFDHTDEPDRTTLRAVIDYWWAPFQDAERGEAAAALTRARWVRLHLGYLCPHQGTSGDFCVQTNVVRPVSHSCRHCSTLLARSEEAPRIQLLP